MRARHVEAFPRTLRLNVEPPGHSVESIAMSLSSPSRLASAPARARRAPRFEGRRTRSWPCPSPARFSILFVYELHDVVVQLSGALDETAPPVFDQCVDAAIAEGPRRLIVEMSALDAIDDDGVRSLDAARRRSDQAGVEFVVDTLTSAVSASLEDAGLKGTFFVR
jgi:anti-anti-sigma factor